MFTAITELFQYWKSFYKVNRGTTIALSTVFLLSNGILFGYWYSVDKRSEEAEKKRVENLSYNKQLEALNNVQGSLNNLIQFVELEKLRLKESEDLINTLKSEQEKLRPVVEANRQTVDAILEVQARKQYETVWYERAFGFLLGIISSILASAIIGIIRFVIRRRQSPSVVA